MLLSAGMCITALSSFLFSTDVHKLMFSLAACIHLLYIFPGPGNISCILTEAQRHVGFSLLYIFLGRLSGVSFSASKRGVKTAGCV